MGISSRGTKALAQGIFYTLILTLLVSRAVSSNISHDENQFIAPGQFLAYDGRMPYVDYPYTHMPYAVPLYALSAALSDYDLLAGRLLSVLFWLGSLILMVAVGRSLNQTPAKTSDGPAWTRLMWEFALVLAFVQDATAQFILGTALNHAPATFFSLLAMLFFVRGVRQAGRTNEAAFWSGLCVAAAGLTRFNYASLIVVFFVGWLGHGLLTDLRAWKPLIIRFGAGALTASLPALGLAALAPRQFYYGNIAYIRLNTVYHEVILHRTGMDLDSKLSGFVSVLRAQPIEALLYAALVFTLVGALVRARRNRGSPDVARLSVAGAALALWMTAFAPTPALLQYMAAPLPFLFILVEAIEFEPPRLQTAIRMLGGLVVGAMVLAGLVKQDAIADLAQLTHPEQWLPVQVHELAMNVRGRVPKGQSAGTRIHGAFGSGTGRLRFHRDRALFVEDLAAVDSRTKGRIRCGVTGGTYGLVAGAATGRRAGGIRGTESGL